MNDLIIDHIYYLLGWYKMTYYMYYFNNIILIDTISKSQ